MTDDRDMHTGARFRLRMTRGRVALGLGGLLAAAIAANATLFQAEKHPAPMFRTLARPQAAKVDLPTPPQRREASAREPVEAPRVQAQAEAPGELNEFLLRDIQTELGRRGFYKSEPDGMPGPATTKAIREFQSAQRMSVDGVPSEALLASIRAVRFTMKDELHDLVKRTASPDKAALAAVAAGAGAAAIVAARKGEPARGPSPKAPEPRRAEMKKTVPALPAKQAGVLRPKADVKSAATPKAAPAKVAPVKAAAKAAPVKAAPKTASAPKAAPKAEAPRATSGEPRLVPPLPVASAQDARPRR